MKNNITHNIDKFGTAGLLLTAILSPCCFPLFAFGASALGLGAFELFGSWTMWIFQAMVLISLVGLFISYRKHRYTYPLIVGVPSAISVFYGFYFATNGVYFIYTGMFGLFISTGINYYRNKLHGKCDTCVIYNGKEVE